MFFCVYVFFFATIVLQRKYILIISKRSEQKDTKVNITSIVFVRVQNERMNKRRVQLEDLF